MKTVCIESPYTGNVESNLFYLRRCLKHSLSKGEAPFASHALYTQAGVLDDCNPEERAQGIRAGLAFALVCDITAVYVNNGISEGMKYGVAAAIHSDRPIVYRMFVSYHECLESDNLAELGVLYARYKEL
jgi:hypothetical protein